MKHGGLHHMHFKSAETWRNEAWGRQAWGACIPSSRGFQVPIDRPALVNHPQGCRAAKGTISFATQSPSQPNHNRFTTFLLYTFCPPDFFSLFLRRLFVLRL